jgi:sugar/nucleoside kinase (ribokinase family)
MSAAVCRCNSALSLQVVAAANSLISRGARHVLVTLAERGSVLVAGDGSVTRQPALPVPGGVVVDATAAGRAPSACMAAAQYWTQQSCQQSNATSTVTQQMCTLYWFRESISKAGAALTGLQCKLPPKPVLLLLLVECCCVQLVD